jgi:hypothetical protein
VSGLLNVTWTLDGTDAAFVVTALQPAGCGARRHARGCGPIWLLGDPFASTASLAG